VALRKFLCLWLSIIHAATTSNLAKMVSSAGITAIKTMLHTAPRRIATATSMAVKHTWRVQQTAFFSKESRTQQFSNQSKRMVAYI
jgi:hypothetical protein